MNGWMRKASCSKHGLPSFPPSSSTTAARPHTHNTFSSSLSPPHTHKQTAMSSTGTIRGLNKGFPVEKLEVPKRPAARKGVSKA